MTSPRLRLAFALVLLTGGCDEGPRTREAPTDQNGPDAGIGAGSSEAGVVPDAATRPTSSFDFANGTTSPKVLIGRSGTGWYWNADKRLVAAPADIGRITHNGETGERLGLLVEPAATNLLRWGRRLGEGVREGEWSANRMVVADDVSGRDGGARKASTLTASAAGATILAAKRGERGNYTFSAWVRRKAGHGRVDITIDGGSSWIEMTAHLLGGQWIRIGSHYLGVGDALADPSVGFRLDEAGDEIEVDLCQLEAGPAASSEIPTEGTTLTRPTETLSIDGADRGRGYRFAWPEAATLRGARWLRQLSFSKAAEGGKSAVTMTYRTDELGQPDYTQTVVQDARAQYTTLWVRPGPLDLHYEGPYGKGDGSSYDNAIAGLMEVPWGQPHLQVIIAGQHVKRWTGEATIASHAAIPVGSGSSDTPVIVRGDASRFAAKAQDGVIIGGMIDEESTRWTDLGGGVWSRTETRYNFSSNSWGLRLTGEETRLDDYATVLPVPSSAECKAKVDSSYHEGSNPWTLQLHLRAGADPNRSFVMPSYGYRFANDDKSHIIYYGLQFGLFASGSGSNLEWRRCKARFGQNLFGIHGTRPGCVVDRCHLQHGTSGVYLFSDKSHISAKMRVTSSEIYDIAKEWFNEQPSDGHAIAARHGIDGYYIDGNRTERTGHPIVMYNYSSTICRDVQIRRTVCRAVHPHYRAPNWNGIAINPADAFNSASWDKFNATNNLVERCYVDGTNMDHPIRNGIMVDHRGDKEVFKVLNCQVDGGQYGIALANTVATNNRVSTGYLRGNVLRGQTKAFIYQAAKSNERRDYARNGGLNSDRNRFIKRGNNPPVHVQFGSAPQTLAEWQAESPRFDPNTIVEEMR